MTSICRAIHARAVQRGQDVLAVSVKKLVGARRGRARAASSSGPAAARRRRSRISPASSACAARTMRRTRRRRSRRWPFSAFTPPEMQRGLRSFPGLAHRMEEIGRLGRVLFINDSKATNADSTEKALTSWPGDIYWILGGKSKDGGIETLRAVFPACGQGLSHRRGERRVRGDARQQCSLRALWHAGCGAGCGRARCCGERGARACGAAVAGLRVV